MLDPGSYTGTYKVIAGELCLDFANTVSWRGTARHHEWLHTYANLARWGQLVGILTEQETLTLIEQADQYPEAADQVLQQAGQLREAINTIFMDIKNEESIPQDEVQILNGYLPEALRHMEIGIEEGRAAWVWSHEGPTLGRMLWPIVWSAANLLMSDQIGKLRACDACNWLFLDTTRNHSRRWCAMEDCGNRAKIRRFRQKG